MNNSLSHISQNMPPFETSFSKVEGQRLLQIENICNKF